MNTSAIYNFSENPSSSKEKARSYYINDLIYYDIKKKKNSELKKGLLEFKTILNISLSAMEALLDVDLEKFDALVGENACQIRAVWISTIISNAKLKPDKIKKEVCRAIIEVNNLLELNSIDKLMSSGTSLGHVLSNRDLFIQLDSIEFFIIQCFILSETKVAFFNEECINPIVVKEKCDPNRLKKFGNVSSSFTKKVVSKARKNVSASSVQFVRELAYKSQNKSLAKMLSDDFTIHYNEQLVCTPMFWTYKSILFAAKSANIPLIIHVKFLECKHHRYINLGEDWLFFEPVLDSLQGEKRFILNELIPEDYDKAAWVMEGVVEINDSESFSKKCWKHNFLQHPIETVILSGAADHRQYPDEEQNILIDVLQDHEFETYKSFAKAKGFSLSNPSLFLITHVYSAVIGKFISNYQKSYSKIALVNQKH